MRITLPDADHKLRLISELARTSLKLRDDFIRKNRERLLPIFLDYQTSPGPILRPSYQAVLLGFQDAWLRGEYQAILSVGEKLPAEFIEHYPEIRAFLGGALDQMGRKARR